jgi:hypothetical protein
LLSYSTCTAYNKAACEAARAHYLSCSRPGAAMTSAARTLELAKESLEAARARLALVGLYKLSVQL